jgi:hypothetical protein
MIGRSESMHDFRREVGIGSRSHCLSGDDRIIFFTSLSVAV